MRHPAIELLGRYWAVGCAAWAARWELAGPQRHKDELAFLPAALSLQETPLHPAPRRTAWVLCGLFTLALGWSIWGQIDIVAVAQGRIVVSERTKLIQPLETSVVRRVLTKEGDVVQAGQVLVELDATQSSADETSVQDQLRAATSDEQRSTALLRSLTDMQPPQTTEANDSAQLQAQWQDITSKLGKLGAEQRRREAEIVTVQASIGKLEATLPLAHQREADIHALSEQGFMAGHAGQDRTRERVEQEQDLLTQRARLAEARAALVESQQARTAYVAETRHALNERQAQAKLKRQQLTQESVKSAQRSRLTQLTAPVSGTVQQVVVHTAGGVVTPAQVLMVIVPKDAQVTAEVIIDNKDIGFVHAGQEVTVKLETFPFTRYGTLDASVKSVSADAVNDEQRGAIFPALLTLQQRQIDVDGKRIALSPGMNVTAEVKTGRRRVIDYLFSPVRKALDESLGER